MTWVTKKRIKVNRAATAWLIRRFIDRGATIRFVEPEEVADVQRREGATGFDAPGATYPHRDARGRCSFEALVEEHCVEGPALVALARIVRGADFRDQINLTPESAGLRAISDGFPLVARDDYETVEKATFLYDALHAGLRERVGGNTPHDVQFRTSRDGLPGRMGVAVAKEGHDAQDGCSACGSARRPGRARRRT